MPQLHRIEARSAGKASSQVASLSIEIGDLVEFGCEFCHATLLTVTIAEGPIDFPVFEQFAQHTCPGLEAWLVKNDETAVGGGQPTGHEDVPASAAPTAANVDPEG